MKLEQDREHPFDRDVPIHNWYYPLAVETLALSPTGVRQFLDMTRADPTVRRALYLHIPFCDTICSFCPFVRKSAAENDLIDAYFSVLLTEIRTKSKLSDNKINAIFIGGGTPSLLSALQINQLGEILQSSFDLSEIQEFSFEVEVKSVTAEKLKALKTVGVTNVRLGVQTLQDQARNLLDLTAPARDAKSALELMLAHFDLVSADMLYAYDGQRQRDLEADIKEIINTGVPLIELYPLNPVASQTRFHKRAGQLGLRPATARTRHEYRLTATDMLANAGYFPHNGHGFIRTRTSGYPTTDAYHFDYHENVYGYKNYEILGFGANAISSIQGISLQNTGLLHQYMHDVLEHGVPCGALGRSDAYSRESRPLIFRLPYFGSVEKAAIDFLNVYPETLQSLLALIRHGMVEDIGQTFRITRLGWIWYTNCMYFLLPQHEKEMIDVQVSSARKDKRAALENEHLRLDA
ncbi:coproporphyrinogen-III oxidase family protein [Bradyrhizobium sp. CCGB01]|uniref:coproporphyrinogen-III oxidase family protein n=1 Tax=Bradyrhizobium sp. CCGB01 TaxID=2949634 RepID=UPI0020B3879A|nr:radical SAM protein [Bradyrhizobium sp. CCGB01]MCP3411347.1 radical SAM protein [Bradyrhizobium sp. CCGB01]